MRTILASLILFLSVNGFSQTVIAFGKTNSGGASTSLVAAVNGVPIMNYQYTAIVEGSPFLNEKFVTGRIILSNGEMYDSIWLRLDLIDNTVHYMNAEGEELVAKVVIKTIHFYDSVSKKETRFDYSDFITPAIETGWYQLLDTGAVRLYKRHVKSIREDKAYNSANTEQYITTAYHYYILVNSIFTPVKKLKSLPDMLQHKKAELQQYINSNSLTGKSDKDYMALVAYYNSLVAKK